MILTKRGLLERFIDWWRDESFTLLEIIMDQTETLNEQVASLQATATANIAAVNALIGAVQTMHDVILNLHGQLDQAMRGGNTNAELGAIRDSLAAETEKARAALEVAAEALKEPEPAPVPVPEPAPTPVPVPVPEPVPEPAAEGGVHSDLEPAPTN